MATASRNGNASSAYGMLSSQRIARPDRLTAEMREDHWATELIIKMSIGCKGRVLVSTEGQPNPASAGSGRAAREWRSVNATHPRRRQVVFRLPPWILLQSPAGSSTKDLASRACVAWPAQEWAPSAQSFLAAALMP